jgi:hypothetical protein
MGMFWMEDDIYIASQLDLLNLRFSPPQGKPNLGKDSDYFGGIEEMVALQKEFQIFKKGRSFSMSARILDVGGPWNRPLKNKLYRYLDTLSERESSVSGKNADECLVEAMIKNLKAEKDALPVYFQAHSAKIVAIEKTRPLSYLEQDYLTVSLPMKARKISRPRRS